MEPRYPPYATIWSSIPLRKWSKYKEKTLAARGGGRGIRVQSRIHEVEKEIYNPCAPFSRLGVSAEEYRCPRLERQEGIHFHTLCEQN
jgi:carboxynorspermidine decarboxylase